MDDELNEKEAKAVEAAMAINDAVDKVGETKKAIRKIIGNKNMYLIDDYINALDGLQKAFDDIKKIKGYCNTLEKVINKGKI